MTALPAIIAILFSSQLKTLSVNVGSQKLKVVAKDASQKLLESGVLEKVFVGKPV